MMVQKPSIGGQGCTITVHKWFARSIQRKHRYASGSDAARAFARWVCRANATRPQAVLPLGEPTGTLHGVAVKVS